MKLNQVQTFLVVAHLRHFGRAAERLNTTQPNVSARIRELEEELGGRLFSRGRGGVTPTRLGAHLLPYAEKVLNAISDLTEQANADFERGGRLRIALSETMVTTVLPPFMKLFAERFPETTLDVSVDSSVNQRRMLAERSIDIAFMMGPMQEPGIANTLLTKIDLTWVAAPNHPLAGGARATAAELVRWPIICQTRHSQPFRNLRAALRAQGVERARYFCSNSLNASVRMAQDGLGVAISPKVFVASLIKAGALVELEADVEIDPLNFTVSYDDDPSNSLAVKAAAIAVLAARAAEQETRRTT